MAARKAANLGPVVIAALCMLASIGSIACAQMTTATAKSAWSTSVTVQTPANSKSSGDTKQDTNPLTSFIEGLGRISSQLSNLISPVSGTTSDHATPSPPLALLLGAPPPDFQGLPDISGLPSVSLPTPPGMPTLSDFSGFSPPVTPSKTRAFGLREDWPRLPESPFFPLPTQPPLPSSSFPKLPSLPPPPPFPKLPTLHRPTVPTLPPLPSTPPFPSSRSEHSLKKSRRGLFHLLT